ncbi:hypothetical protein MKX08_008218 [Trichoderma sp. CBMAI-0020]|nr:hypothetical protein MKX08_008218 [Trichoderma sp. CBMAI-0020]
MSDPRNYTVGWICALSTEQIAAAAFLDEQHAPLEDQPSHDSNNYILGSMGKHNVAIAVLPLEYGTASASNVATNLLRTFPNIRIGLLVGIGGGAPSDRHDIRLGDVVVSAPSAGNGGVFQYDFGKTIQGEAFQHTRFLNQSPAVLRSAVASLQTKYMLDGHQLKENIESVLATRKRLKKLFGRPKTASDMLFRPQVVHDEGGCTAVCARDESNLVLRCERTEDEDDPAVHYGLIASANRVMKDALIRDKLSAERDVLCFEMEAAGLMNNFPCLVIRGICDYSDSHKSKEWQGFAAMTAAAYAKDLLGIVLPSKVEAEQRLSEVLTQVSDTVANIETNVKDIRSRMSSEEDLKILNWLADSNYSSQHNDYLSRRQQGTGQWLLDSKEYQDWLSMDKQTLFCPGIPGAGKTILTAIVVENLHTRFNNDPTVGIAYNYYNFKSQDQQTANKLMASLLRQLCFSQSSLPEAVKSLYDRHYYRKTQPSLDEIASALQSVVKTFSQVFIAIDALDECRIKERPLFLFELFKIQTEIKANIFATSRPILEIKNVFQGCISLDVVASRDDIYKYLDGHMSTLPKFVHDNINLKEQIKSDITKVAQGMFLLAQLYLGTLEDRVTPKEMKQSLKRFQQRSQDQMEDQKLEVLRAIYDDTMKRIKEQKPGFCHLATSALSWLCHAKRQLKKSELQHALAVHMELDSGSVPQEFDDDSVPEVDLIVSSCQGLVTIDEESDIIRLVHYTTQEYFDRMRQEWFPEAETTITNVCTLYITITDFVYTQHRGFGRSVEKELQLDPFFGYACANWGNHARGANSSSRIIHNFLANEQKVKTAAQVMSEVQYYEAGDSRVQHATIITALDLTAYFGAVELIKKLPSILNTSLGAAELGHAIFGALCNEQGAALRLLIDMGADITVTELFKEGLLSLAAFHGDLDAVRLLLDLGADPNERNEWLEGPVEKAAGQGHRAVVRLLLERGGSFGNQEDGDRTVVDYAVETDDKAMIRDFFEMATEPKKEESLKALLLRAALIYKRMEYIEMVLEMGPLPKLMGELGSKLLCKAMTECELPKETIELLYERGARPIEGSKEEILRKTKLNNEWLAERIPSLFMDQSSWGKESCCI